MNNSAASIQQEKKHASVGLYMKIAVILTVITIVEVAYPYLTQSIDFLHPFYMPVLGILSLAKFVLVVAFYMHLRYDPAILQNIFIFSLVVAVLITIALLLLFLL